MRLRYLAVLSALVLSSYAVAARLALVIGNDTYQNVTKLKNARADASSMADALSSAGYVVSLPCLCEFGRVLKRLSRVKSLDASGAIRVMLATSNVQTNRPAVEAELAVLDAGGDFADGVIAYEGWWLAGETFVSFDKQAVDLRSAQGHSAQLL